MPSSKAAAGPGVLDALSLAVEVADGLGVSTVRDTHLALVDRVHGVVDRPLGRASSLPGRAHRAVASGVYAGLGAGLRAAGRGLDTAAASRLDARVGRRLDDHPRGRLLRAAVNGLIGDRLADERPRWAIPMAVRVDGRDVDLTSEAVRAAYPTATGRIVVFLHGLCEDESSWRRRRDVRGTTYAEGLADRGWTPVMLRANTGLTLRANGAALTAVLQRLTQAWPVPVERIALVGHSMGGLVVRAAADVVDDSDDRWVDRVTDVVTLGTPHLGSPVAGGVGAGSRALARLPEAAALGRILDWRSVGVHDLVHGLAHDVPPLPHARYRLVAATLTRSPRHPVGAVLGDTLVRLPSAYGRGRSGELFPDADVLHVGGAGHLDLLNHPRVHEALLDWLR
ncbi:lipase family alpha/beta hydrolase [Nocardioides sp. Soil805]|uniref:lipase family alpha/beta hydrolase n=1 Tax=Nocardioides sp. Soil805 TaxID=1736416 RepID=UPI0009E79338|nr:alpha/beta hydrolase [Nocardioides sp. Soil805]